MKRFLVAVYEVRIVAEVAEKPGEDAEWPSNEEMDRALAIAENLRARLIERGSYQAGRMTLRVTVTPRKV